MRDWLFPEIPRIYTALAEWAASMVFILTLRRKVHNWKLALISAGVLCLLSLFLILTTDVNVVLWMPCMAVAVLIMLFFIYVCCDTDWKNVVYFGLHAFVAAEFAASFEWQVYCYFFKEKAPFFVEALLMAVIYGVIFAIIWYLLHRQQDSERGLDIREKELFSGFIIAVSIFAVSNISFISVNTPFSSEYAEAVATIRTMVDFGGVAIMYAHYVMLYDIRTRREIDVLQNVIQNQYLQYQQSKESIELINYKYHDLRHQIGLLRMEEDREKREAYLKQMEEGICQYEAQNKTGNKVVDAVLTSKDITCQKCGITLNCVVNGKLMDFMDTMDICSILGNALDNAIECERKVDDSEKRLIRVAIFSQKNFLIMRFENYFNGELNMKEGIPLTTKNKAKELHGYGIKSINYTVKKYNGGVTINTRNNWFELKILIPIPSEKDDEGKKPEKNKVFGNGR